MRWEPRGLDGYTGRAGGSSGRNVMGKRNVRARVRVRKESSSSGLPVRRGGTCVFETRASEKRGEGQERADERERASVCLVQVQLLYK